MNIPTNKEGCGKKRGCHSLLVFIVPAVLTIFLIIVYTIILQSIFSDETLSAGISRNNESSDTVYDYLKDGFSRDDFTELTSESDMGSSRYIELQDQLNTLRRLKGIRYLYTAGRNSAGELVYLVDGLDRSAGDFACPGTLIESEMIPYIESALSGQTVYSHDIVDTTWGHIYAACYPVTADDGSGEVIGALCVEMDMESAYASISSGGKRILIMTVAAIVLMILMTVPIHLVRQKHKELERQRSRELQDSLDRVKEREMILEALAYDYDSVYLCDLESDKTVIIKEDQKAYDPNAYVILGDKAESYSFRTENYFKYFVEQDSAPDLPEKLSNASLMKYLSDHDNFTCRYKVKPNPTGRVFLETKVVRVRSEEGFKVVMGFHYIDEIVEEQEQQKSRLESALYEAERNNEIISAIAKIYQLIYFIDLTKNTYERVAAGEYTEQTGASHGSLVGMIDHTLTRFVAPEWHGEMRAFLDMSTLAERLKDRDSVSAECQGTTGRWYRVRFIVKNTDENGVPTGVLYVAREISDEKQQELELKQRLKETAEEAERANASKTDFLRRMSHDVRTPINGIRGMVEIANYYPNDMKKQKECRDKIWDSTSHLLSLVNNILDMNKLESGRITLQHKPFDLMKLISETDSITEMQAIEHNVRFISGHENSAITHRYLIGSETHLKQILLNFSSNAVKYNRDGGSVSLCCRELSDDGRTAEFRFTCEDTGIGMSEEFQKHAFEPFVQEENGATTTYAGSGLGLSIAKQLVELMGGTVELHSRENSGTTVSFTLPFEIDQQPHDTDTAEPLSGINMSGVKILLAEDNDLNAEIAEFLLEKYGITVVRAENGRQAVDIFAGSAQGEFSVIFMDVMMPVMNGLDAAREIRELDRPDAATVPIFAMTANAFVDDIQRSYDAGMNEHLTKPLQESEIMLTLKKYVRNRGI